MTENRQHSDQQNPPSEFGRCHIPSRKEHYARNSLSLQFPEVYDEDFFRGWNGNVPANCHQFSAPKRDNRKLVSEDGKQEVIYTRSGRLVTDPRDIGTYNYSSPYRHPIGHFFKDMLPWYLFGNSPEDSTSFLQRFLSSFKIYLK